MSKEIRWRVLTLQGVLVVVLAFGAGFLFWANSFTTGMVRDQLTAQQIYFPGKDQIKAGGALDPAEFPQEIRDQAGNQVTTGDQARIYANDFIGIHLQKVANGLTFAQITPAIAKLDKNSPTYAADSAKLTAAKATLFQGETLRGLLLQAYAWWTMGVYALYAAIGLALATLAVFAAFVFELLFAPRIERPTIRTLHEAKVA